MSISLVSAPALPSERTAPRDAPSGAAGAERLQLLRCMLADRDWSSDPLVRARLERIVEQLRRPGGAPAIDEAGWTLLADETANYLDYRRLGKVEAELRGCARNELRFTRADWEVSRLAEAALHAHHRQVREGSYAPEPAPLFRIH
ncbi:hypothetical protein [Pseudoxanthomonas putridarboris]|uniref:Uncharacterized protein n=1 Tax=Pseudoxanthomonas putridarboris TaxID=752605 RepID=A0ABU9IZ24_9GAMM